ncbi:MAG: hypothetical protein ACREB6_08310 [Rhodospirillales bacterium]
MKIYTLQLKNIQLILPDHEHRRTGIPYCSAVGGWADGPANRGVQAS